VNDECRGSRGNRVKGRGGKEGKVNTKAQNVKKGQKKENEAREG
jgi:hypothetical protein